jgi:hypothetical protein
VVAAGAARRVALALLCGAICAGGACADPLPRQADAEAGAADTAAPPTASSGPVLPSTSGAPSAVSPTATATASATAGAASAGRAAGAVRPGEEAGAAELMLETARIVSATATTRRGKGAAFLVRLEQDGASLPALMLLAPRAAQSSHRRALAYARLAGALGFDVAAPVRWRRVGVGELGALTPTASHAVLERTVAIQNDGTVDALMEAAPPAGARRLAIDGAPEARAWQGWAASPTPVAGEERTSLRGWVELLILDWLAGNAARRAVWLDTRSGHLVAHENAAGFPQRYDARATDPALARLREVVRFPTGLHAALRLLDRQAAVALFNRGDFEGWLLSPRSLVALDERRLTLLSLLEARFAEHGRPVVESL